MHKNHFDIIMDHIEENVTKSTEEIKKDIPKLIGRHSRAFGEHFNLLTGYTLDYYIKQRRLNYAARELVRHQEKPICDIALEYHFSDQSAFTRAIKAKYGVTPSEIRKEGFGIFEERFYFTDFTGREAPDTDVAKLLRSMEIGGPFDIYEFDLMVGIEKMSDELGFDIDTCYQIADLAERLNISLSDLAQHCFVAKTNEEYARMSELHEICKLNDIMRALQIESTEELEAICAHYKCEYYELDELKVYLYRKQINQKK